MDKIFILGINQAARKLYNIIQSEGIFEVIGFCAEKKYIQESEFLGLPVVSLEELPHYITKENISDYKGVLNTIGYSQMNAARQRIFIQYEDQISFVSYVSSRAMVDPGVSIGKGAIIFPTVYIGPNCKIGAGVIITVGTSLTHDVEVGQYTYMSSEVVCGGNVKIGNNCFIGLNSTIRNGITIADKTFVGAACYIAHDTEKNSVYVQKPTMCKEGITADEIIERV